MLKVEAIDNFDKFNSLELIWNKLLSQSDADNVFMTFEWLSCWWKAFGKDKELLILLTKDGKDITGVAPLMRYRMKIRGLSVKAVGFMTNEHTNRAGFIILKNERETVQAILDYLANLKNSISVYNFEYIPENSITDKLLNKAANKNGLGYIRRPTIQSPYLTCEGSWDEYFKSRSRRSKKKINYVNNLLKENNPAVITYSDIGFKKGVEEMIDISKHTWKYKSNTAIVSSPENQYFYNSLAQVAADKGWLSLNVLKLTDSPVAFEFNLIYKEKAYAVKTGFDEKYSRFSPSNFLAHSVIKDCFNGRLKEYDLLGDNENYKMEWASLCRKHYQYLIFNENYLGILLFFIENNTIPFLRNIKSFLTKKDARID